jgi:acid stress-induced BolA-like protein IbaG/YrbA
MESEAIKSLLIEHIAGAEVEVDAEGSHVSLRIVSPVFDGLNSLKRQQTVYGVLSEHIASGEIHAVNMKTFTPQEASSE